MRLTFWKIVFLFLMAAGLYATVVRFTQGLGSSTNLSDQFPWGIWVSFDVLCGVMLAAGIPKCEIGVIKSSLPVMMTSWPALRTAVASGTNANTVAGLPAVTKRIFMARFLYLMYRT